MVYTCARYVFALLIAVDTAVVDMAVSSSAFAFGFDAVDIQLYRAGDMHLYQIYLRSAERG